MEATGILRDESDPGTQVGERVVYRHALYVTMNAQEWRALTDYEGRVIGPALQLGRQTGQGMRLITRPEPGRLVVAIEPIFCVTHGVWDMMAIAARAMQVLQATCENVIPGFPPA